MTEQRFSKYSQVDRINWLTEQEILEKDSVDKLVGSVTPEMRQISDRLIENSIGAFCLPLGIVPGVHLDGKEYTVPMAVEETSVIAAASYIAKWVKRSGSLTTIRQNRHIIGQIQFLETPNIETIEKFTTENKHLWIEKINTNICPGMVARGGGMIDITFRKIPLENNKERFVIHLIFDPCDAMGANIINQACEFLKYEIETHLPGVNALMAILSNLNDYATVKSTLVIENIDSSLAEKIENASLCALTDPYRAATHNKGIFNGIDPILIATGNDWRAAEAGAHAYAARTGKYLPLSVWKKDGNNLVGTIEMPMVTAIVGGVTNIHPLAKIALDILKVSSADELDRLVVSMGLVQNLAALKALTTEGISRGHMSLHIKNYVTLFAKSPEEFAFAEEKLKDKLIANKHISMVDAKEAVNEYRLRKA